MYRIDYGDSGAIYRTAVKIMSESRERYGVRISCPPTQADCIDKINELVDAVNELQEAF